ncbi:hypothetical protein Tco_0771214 [Tanacetum coccineum]|uniref:Uncharacterized protein n=1 Tax=Tanacetum coccineum TaxID=301880 RepID=A0ABQ4ZI63_9ASTR
MSLSEFVYRVSLSSPAYFQRLSFTWPAWLFLRRVLLCIQLSLLMSRMTLRDFLHYPRNHLVTITDVLVSAPLYGGSADVSDLDASEEDVYFSGVRKTGVAACFAPRGAMPAPALVGLSSKVHGECVEENRRISKIRKLTTKK